MGSNSPNIINGDVSTSVTTTGDGNDLIIAHSGSFIIGGGGDDIFWLRPEVAGDVFTIRDFGNENSGQGAVGDRFLIVSDQDFTTVGALYTAIGWDVDTDQNVDTDGNNDDIRITVALRGENPAHTIDLRNYNTALTLDDFLVLTRTEAEAWIADFITDNNIAPGIDIL
jgi:hypothetical protein